MGIFTFLPDKSSLGLSRVITNTRNGKLELVYTTDNVDLLKKVDEVIRRDPHLVPDTNFERLAGFQSQGKERSAEHEPTREGHRRLKYHIDEKYLPPISTHKDTCEKIIRKAIREAATALEQEGYLTSEEAHVIIGGHHNFDRINLRTGTQLPKRIKPSDMTDHDEHQHRGNAL